VVGQEQEPGKKKPIKTRTVLAYVPELVLRAVSTVAQDSSCKGGSTKDDKGRQRTIKQGKGCGERRKGMAVSVGQIARP
jgi:hypothetical protein